MLAIITVLVLPPKESCTQRRGTHSFRTSPDFPPNLLTSAHFEVFAGSRSLDVGDIQGWYHQPAFLGESCSHVLRKTPEKKGQHKNEVVVLCTEVNTNGTVSWAETQFMSGASQCRQKIRCIDASEWHSQMTGHDTFSHVVNVHVARWFWPLVTQQSATMYRAVL